MIQELINHSSVRQEGKRLIKFTLVGATSFAIHFFGYLVLSRFIFPEGNRTLLNFMAISVSVSFNFLAHRGWTYKSNEKSVGQIIRYVVVVSTAGLLQTGLFYVGFEIFGLYDLFVTIFVAGISALFSFSAHRFFTFRKASSKKAE